MAIQALIALWFFLVTPSAHAYITVYSSHPSCSDLFLGKTTLQKSTEGYRLSLNRDQTEQSPQRLSGETYSVEVLEAVGKVRSVYAELFEEAKMDPREAEEVLRKFAREDEERVREGGGGKNGPDNTVYFVNRSANGAPRGVLRATLIRGGDSRGLPLERYVKLPGGNRVEFERAFNSPGARSDVLAGEMMTVVAKYLEDYFGSNDYTLYNLTDPARARLYKKDYGFQIERQGHLPRMLGYLCSQSGKDFHYRYVGHIQAAYWMAFSQLPYGSGKDAALALLERFAAQPGLGQLIPNIVARAAISAAFRDYAKAVAVSDSLKAIGHAEINEDYYALWKSRMAFDPFANQGDAARALESLDRYLEQKPLEVHTYNDRALLFLIYRLKLLLAKQDFGAARTLLGEHRELLREGREKMQPVYGRIWKMIQRDTRQEERRLHLELLLDLSTHMEPFATSVLHEESWRSLALVERELGHLEQAERWDRAADVIRDW